MGHVIAPAVALEAGVRTFVDRVMAETARLSGPGPVTLADARRIAETVRGPWREGGPIMARTSEHRASADGREVRVQIYQPDGATGGALVYLHGGGWTLFSLDTHDRLMREYAGRSGLAVVGVDYSLSPEVRFPVAVEETVAAVTWLRRKGPALGIDPARLVLGGDSAGANLALASALALRDAGATPAIRGLLLNYGAYDLAVSDAAARRFGAPGAMRTATEKAAFWAHDLRGPADGDDPLACPLRAELARTCRRCFLAAAECDVLAEQSAALAGRLTAAGVAADLRSLIRAPPTQASWRRCRSRPWQASLSTRRRRGCGR